MILAAKRAESIGRNPRAILITGASRWRTGTIIDISSMGGKTYTPLGAWYHASKHALEGWSDCLRLELAAFGIDVVIFEPGIIQTEFGDVVMDPMLKRSGTGPYASLAKNVAQATKGSYEKGGGSPSSVIADVVSSAVKARRPKSRYAAGKFAKRDQVEALVDSAWDAFGERR